MIGSQFENIPNNRIKNSLGHHYFNDGSAFVLRSEKYVLDKSRRFYLFDVIPFDIKYQTHHYYFKMEKVGKNLFYMGYWYDGYTSHKNYYECEFFVEEKEKAQEKHFHKSIKSGTLEECALHILEFININVKDGEYIG